MESTVEPIEDVFALIEHGGGENDANWVQFDEKVVPHLEIKSSFDYALGMWLPRKSPNEHFRDAAATILARSDFKLLPGDQADLAKELVAETHPFAKWWLANALYDSDSQYPEVIAAWKEACEQDNPAGEFARGLRNSN
jgi:hypothetical protein